MAFFTKSKLKIILIQLSLFIIIGEVATRVLYPLPEHDDPNAIHYGTISPDNEIGWLPKENHRFNDSINDIQGVAYHINYLSAEYGFREFGDVTNDSIKKVLFIGDSFTQAVEVSNGKAFYNVIKDSLGFELFAFGSSGFGTFQEYLVFKKHFQRIKPDLIIWQFCTNDFIDNHFQLENDCQYKNQKRRPYFLNSKTEYHNSEETLRNFLTKHSSLMFNLDKLYRRTCTKLNINKPGEILIVEKGRDYQYFNEAYEATDQIIKLIVSEIDQKAKLVMFCADAYEPQSSFIRELVNANGILFIEDNIHRLNESKSEGEIIFCYDNVHWNEYGHSVVGNALVDAIRRNKTIN